MADLADMSNQFKQMSIDTEDVNILLMGETGVGKSTFINAFANYMEYDKFQVAEKSAVRCLIPSSFSVIDENMQEKQVKIGRDKNENEEVGESATQGARSYVFPLSKYGKRVRLIDTPGVGDTRGLDQDNINFENILAYIGNMEYLHAICFLLKPNNSRLTVYFEYCIKQLLSRLEKSASRNIIFLFTNSRSTFYRPGDTAPALKRILDQIKSKPPNVDIKFERDNVFCLDNEAFRFMVSYKEGIKFTRKDKESFARSWDQSVGECWRMIEYITGQGNSTVKLVPHKVQDTISVNNARRIIIQLSQPLADIADLINDNVNLLQRHNNTLTKENLSMTDLKKRLYVPVVNLRHKELSQPTTVCTNAKCSEIYMVADKKKYHYKQRCHDPCYLRNVPAEMVGSPELIHCYAMLPTKKCRECSCDFSAHMHIYYLTETYQDKITDTGVQSQITDRETAVREAQKLIGKIESRKLAFEEEKEIIVKNMAKFAHFLQHNAIAPYNDAYKAYIEYLIDRENSFGKDADNQLIIYYQDLLKQYDEEKQILDRALQLRVDGSTSAVSSGEVFNAVQALFSLKNTGKNIEELYNKQMNARKAEFEDNTECVLDAVRPRNINPSIKGISKKPQKKKLYKRSSDDEGDGISSDMKEKFQDLLETFPEMEEYFARKHRSQSQKSEDDVSNEDGNERRNNKNQKQSGAYHKGKPGNQQQQRNAQQNKNQGQRNNPRGRGQNPNQGRGSYNRNQNYDGHNQGGPYNQGQGPQNQGPQRAGPHNQNQNRNNQGPGNYNQGRGGYNRGPGGGYNQGAAGDYNQGAEDYNQDPGDYNQGPGPYNQGPGLQNQGPGNFNRGPGPYNQGGPGLHNQGGPGFHNQGGPGPHGQGGPGPYNQGGPGPYNQRGPGPHNQGGPGPYNRGGPGPHNQRGSSPYKQGGPGPHNQDPGFRNQGPGPYDQGGLGPYNQGGPGPYNQRGPGPYNQGGPGPYNQGGPGPYNQGGPGPQQSYNNQDPPPYSPRDYNQGASSNYNQFDNRGGPPNFSYKTNNPEKKTYNRPSGPYQPDDVDEKKSGVDLRHMDKFLRDCETSAQGDDGPPEEDDGDFEDFMRRHGLRDDDNDDQGGAGGYQKNQRGGRGRGGRYRGGGRGGNHRSKSKERFGGGGDADSDSGHSYSSRGTNKSYKRADNFEFIPLDVGGQNSRRGGARRNQNQQAGDKKGVLDFFKGIF